MNAKIINSREVLSWLPSRAVDANKGDFGHVLIIGGDYNMGGAIIMAAEAAFRVGVGRVTVLSRQENFAALLSRLPNAMVACANSKEEAQKIFASKDAIAVGMGLGQSTWAQEMLDAVLSSSLPKIIDADALNLLSQKSSVQFLSNSIITPHPKEASRLLGYSLEQIQQDREAAVKNLAYKYHTTAILKGHDSLIADENEVNLCPYGNAGMAVAGMGDVLSGMIGGFLAQKFSIKNAAILATTIHALAGDEVAQTQGQIGILPTELMKSVMRIVNKRGV